MIDKLYEVFQKPIEKGFEWEKDEIKKLIDVENYKKLESKIKDFQSELKEILEKIICNEDEDFAELFYTSGVSRFYAGMRTEFAVNGSKNDSYLKKQLVLLDEDMDLTP
ncbi:MAG: hypothetical protein KAJ00_04285, partial [Deltaproteobacteria bacterium]|nr:hypothetical protein [Deltaproteobacteria bacterium]